MFSIYFVVGDSNRVGMRFIVNFRCNYCCVQFAAKKSAYKCKKGLYVINGVLCRVNSGKMPLLTHCPGAVTHQKLNH